jgi:nitrate reductase alpha subunit
VRSISIDYCRQYTDMPMLVRWSSRTAACAGPLAARVRFRRWRWARPNNPDWKTVAIDETAARSSCPNGSIGFRWGEKGKWNLEEKDGGPRRPALRLSPRGRQGRGAAVASPISATRARTLRPPTIPMCCPQRAGQAVKLADGEALVATVFDLFSPTTASTAASAASNVAASYDDDVPYTPAWAEKDHRRAARPDHRGGARVRANAEKTKGRSMVIIGAAMNHWYHMDMNYRGVINMLVMCGCVGQSGGGWAHYVGPGEAAAADRLGAARLRARLAPSAAAA